MSDLQTPQKRDGHLIIYWAWPLLIGLGLAVVLAVSVGGVVLLASGELVASGRVAGYVFFGTLGGATLIMVCYVASEWRGPRQAERIEQTRQEVIEVLPDDIEPPPPMIVRGFTPALLPSTLDVTTESITPAVDPEIDFLYRFVLDAWQHNDVTQSGTMARGWRRKDWDHFVGGSRRRADAGKESARGLLDRAGIIAKDGAKWVTCATLEQALSINDDLKRYASEKSKLVVLGKPSKTRQDAAAGVGRVTDLEE